jgi:hypothetical protein
MEDVDRNTLQSSAASSLQEALSKVQEEVEGLLFLISDWSFISYF